MWRRRSQRKVLSSFTPTFSVGVVRFSRFVSQHPQSTFYLTTSSASIPSRECIKHQSQNKKSISNFLAPNAYLGSTCMLEIILKFLKINPIFANKLVKSNFNYLQNDCLNDFYFKRRLWSRLRFGIQPISFTRFIQRVYTLYTKYSFTLTFSSSG